MNLNLGPRPEQYLMPTLAAALAEATDDELVVLARKYGAMADEALEILRERPGDRASHRAATVLNALAAEMLNQRRLRVARDRLETERMEAMLDEGDGDATS